MTNEGSQMETVGVVVDRNHKDGTTADGRTWNRYSFQIEGHWYSSFDDAAWKGLERGKCYRVQYLERLNPKGGPAYRNIEEFAEVPLAPGEAMKAQLVAEQAAAENERRRNGGDEYRRSKEEVRWTEAMQMAMQMVVRHAGDKDWHPWDDALKSSAALIYRLIAEGPPCAESNGLSEQDQDIAIVAPPVERVEISLQTKPGSSLNLLGRTQVELGLPSDEVYLCFDIDPPTIEKLKSYIENRVTRDRRTVEDVIAGMCQELRAWATQRKGQGSYGRTRSV